MLRCHDTMAHGLQRRALVLNPNLETTNKKQARLVTLLAVSLFINASVMPVLTSPVWADEPANVLQGEVEDDEKGEAAPSAPSAPVAEPATTPDASTDKKKLTIDEINIEGNRLVGTEEIQNVLKTKRGDTFVREQVFDDLK